MSDEDNKGNKDHPIALPAGLEKQCYLRSQDNTIKSNQTIETSKIYIISWNEHDKHPNILMQYEKRDCMKKAEFVVGLAS